jgi:hypothetical protein
LGFKFKKVKKVTDPWTLYANSECVYKIQNTKYKIQNTEGLDIYINYLWCVILCDVERIIFRKQIVRKIDTLRSKLSEVTYANLCDQWKLPSTWYDSRVITPVT